jgi:hypothetical protein
MSLNDGVGGQQDLRSDGHRNLPAHGHLVTLCAGGRQHDAPGRTLCHALAVLDPPRVHGHHLRTQSRCAPIPARAHETDAPLCAVVGRAEPSFCRVVRYATAERIRARAVAYGARRPA